MSSILSLDITLIVTVGICLVLVLLNVIFYSINDYIYPDLKPNTVLLGSSQNGNAGSKGNNGTIGTPATSGTDGIPGFSGTTGVPGQKGVEGRKGEVGSSGSIGFPGSPGTPGLPGLPSNSITPTITYHNNKFTDSYILKDIFTYDNTKYQVSLFANIENNSRFILDSNEYIPYSAQVPLLGTPLIPSRNGFYQSPTITIPPGFPVNNTSVGTFVSNIRIAIGYGRGKVDSKNRSDDTIFYVSPPISRKTYLFRYNFEGMVPDIYKNMEIDFPVKPVKNSKEFLYFKPSKTDLGSIKNLKDIYHLLRGIGRYELVVNTFPPLPGSVNFNYRIIEEIIATENNVEFYLPKITFAFNTNNLVLKDPITFDSLTISNRFDLNKVIERDLNFEKITWNQTNKKTIEISIPEKVIPVQYENTYLDLESELADSITALSPAVYYNTGNNALLQAANLDLELLMTIKPKNTTYYTFTSKKFIFGLRKYISVTPLDKFNNLEKLYLKFNSLFLEGTINYGETYSLESVDFKSVYGKSIFLTGLYRFSDFTNGSFVEASQINFVGNIIDLSSAYDLPITVGYTKYKTNERYSTQVMCQEINIPGFRRYYFNIPLYGYKKE